MQTQPTPKIDWATQMAADHQRALHVAKQRSALEAARHELTTLHGLIAADGAAPHETWSIDTSSVVAMIDEALTSLDIQPAEPDHPCSSPHREGA